MDKKMEGLKKILYAGIGGVAVTAEKMKDILDVMIEKGEITVEQGKVLNQELKHNIKKTVKENSGVSPKENTEEEISSFLEKMTPEQMTLLKAQIEKIQADSEKDVSDKEEVDEQ